MAWLLPSKSKNQHVLPLGETDSKLVLWKWSRVTSGQAGSLSPQAGSYCWKRITSQADTALGRAPCLSYLCTPKTDHALWPSLKPQKRTAPWWLISHCRQCVNETAGSMSRTVQSSLEAQPAGLVFLPVNAVVEGSAPASLQCNPCFCPSC